jgi:hypothetical protein
MFQTMVDMAKTPDEVKKDMADMAVPATSAKPTTPVYPYGLCISLTEEEMAKLGLEGDLPQIGEMIHLAAMAKVTSVSQNEREDASGKKVACCRVELQITHLATENEDEEGDRVEMAVKASAARRRRFYGAGAADGE